MSAMHFAQRQSGRRSDKRDRAGPVPEGAKKRPRPKTGPDRSAEPDRKWGQRAGRRIALCHELRTQGRRRRSQAQCCDTQVRREEEIGVRLSNNANMNSTDLIDNPFTDMSAMHFCRARPCRQKEKGPARGESGAQGGRQSLPGGNAADAREGGETSAVLWAIYERIPLPPTAIETCQPCPGCMTGRIFEQIQWPDLAPHRAGHGNVR